MKESVYKSYDELPLFISSETLSELLGISLSSCYELMHDKDFPLIRIGKRMVVEKSRFIEWVKNNTAGDKRCWKITCSQILNVKDTSNFRMTSSILDYLMERYLCTRTSCTARIAKRISVIRVSRQSAKP